MTKSEFIEKLTEALSFLPGQERVRILEYFEEMIDDRIESGMAEEEAVAAMGSIEDILKEAAPDSLNRVQKTQPQQAAALPGAKTFKLSDPVETLICNSASAELNIRSGKLPDGLTARVECDLSEDEECICTLENSTLMVKYNNLRQRGFSLRNLFSSHHSCITITLSNAALVRGEISASSGNVTLNELVFTDSLNVRTASGELIANDIAVQLTCELHAASGDITAKNLTCGELLKIHTGSGDADLANIRAGKIDIGSASGDQTLNTIECDRLEAGSASGDIQLKDAKAGEISTHSSSGDATLFSAVCSGLLEMNSASGDLRLQDSQCSGEIRLSSSSGDIRGRLIPPENYRYSARSRTGDVKVPHYEGGCPVDIHTTSGDITFKAY